MRERISGKLTTEDINETKDPVHQTRPNSDDEEKGLPRSDVQEAPNGDNSEKPGDRSPVVVIRNTNLNIIPNLTLNVHNQVGRGELYIVAILGIVLQLGVLVYFGIAAKYLRPTLLKDEEPVADYAFPCTAAGTLLLAAGMLVCGHIVENSTLETNYRPVAGKEARVVWLQRSGTVNDQAFKPFAVFPDTAQTILTTSQRQNPNRRKSGHEMEKAVWNEEVKAVTAIMVCLCGYIVQFIGLRGMHWSASIAQLGAIGVMTVLRAWVRRNIAQLPMAQPLTPEYELDWLAMTLAVDRSKAPWLGESSAPKNRGSRPWAEDENGWDWKVSGVQDPVKCKELKPHLGAADDRSKADEVMKTRRDLGKLAGWHGPASAEAISLKRAIEITMDILCGRRFENPGGDPSEDLTDNLSWSLEVSGKPVHFRLKREQSGSWKAFSDELEAALSLWLYSTYDIEQGMQETKPVDRGPQIDNRVGGTSRAGNGKEDGGDIQHDHTATDEDEDDAWLQVQGTLSKHSLRILGAYSPSLRQDLHWWMPDGAASVLEIEIPKPTDEVGTAEVESHRITGFVPGWNSDSASKTRRYRVLSSELKDKALNRVLATESYSALKAQFAQYMFSAFMWAVAKKMKEPMQDPQVEVRPIVADGEGSDSWQSFTLHSVQLSKLAQDIQTTGIGTLEEVYLCIIPPLSISNRLPQADAIIQLTRKHAQPHEQLGRWNEAGEVYLWLFRTSQAFPEQDKLINKATALLMEYLRTVTAAIKLSKDQQIEGQTIRQLDELRMRLLNELKSARKDILVKLMTLYRWQRRSWKCDLAEETIAQPRADTAIQFTKLHAYCSVKYGMAIGQTTMAAHINSRDIHDRTPLHYAAIEDTGRPLSEILRHRPNVNAQDIRRQTPLHLACWQDNASTVRLLLREGASIGIRDVDGLAPLHSAASHGNLSVVQSLIEAGADVNLVDSLGMTPLLWAAYKGHLNLVQYLWDNANKRSRDHNGRTPLHLAAIGDVKRIVDRKQMVEALINAFAVEKDAKDRFGRTPLHFAAQAGHTDIVTLLAESGADIEARNSHKWTPLRVAIQAGQTDTVKRLVEIGVNIEARDSEDNTPLYVAAQEGHLDIVKLLIEKSKDIDAKNGSDADTPLHAATRMRHMNIAELLIEKGADINVKDETGNTPLYTAAWEGYANVVGLLIEKGADINARNEDDSTPLHSAAWGGRMQFISLLENHEIPPPKVVEYKTIVDLLIKKGADIDAKRGPGETPLHSAAEVGNAGTVELLLEKGADINTKDKTGQTPLHTAIIKEADPDAIKLLIKKGADINTKKPNGETLLHSAAEVRNAGIVELLLEKGVDINAKDRNGRTPLHIAIYKGYTKVVRLLLEKGADMAAKTKDHETPLDVANDVKDEDIIRLLVEKGAGKGVVSDRDSTPLALDGRQAS